MDYERPWEQPLEEEYWHALLRDGENVSYTAPPSEGEEVWRSLGIEQDTPAQEETDDNIGGSTSDEEENDWQLVHRCFIDNEIVELPVTGYNRGGLLVQWNSLQGFVPASQLVGMSFSSDEDERREELACRVGHTLTLRVIEIDRERNRLILSERAAVPEDDQVDELLAEICEGDVLRGRVTNLCDFGAFVDLGGVEGLVHISELSWSRVRHPRDVLSPGQEVDVYVLNVDRAQRRIALSLKRLLPDPWSEVEERYRVGQLVEGVITNVVSFGAFARVEEGLEGLIHISELAEGNFLHPRNVVQEGDVVKARIVHIDGARHRLGLSLRRVTEWKPGGLGESSELSHSANMPPA
ncbi:MAG: S1 RNA-binding domain-containing protein [Anaerolineae bacterium]|nr:S1 RNA-binding domain-containing protein [Anaerolineae bacterium]